MAVSPPRREIAFGILLALFVTLVVLTNTVGVKLFTLFGQTLPVSIAWFPVTFLITDVVSEVYGPTRARFLVLMGFAMSLVLLSTVLVGLSLPAAEVYAIDGDYRRVFAPTWRLLFASMCAYLLAQMADVKMFHFWKRVTRGRRLWLRNNASTVVSQLIDTFTVNFIFLYENPAVFTGDFWDLLRIVFSVYVIKVGIALVDTPLCYAGVWALERFAPTRE